MKKIILPGLIIFLLTSVRSTMYAQGANHTNKYSPEIASIHKVPPVSNAARAAAGIPIKAVRNFIKKYEDATEVKWFRLDEGGSAVHFFNDGIKTKVFYNRRGIPAGTIRYYTEDKLPFEVRHLVKSTFYDFSIFLVIEVTVKNETAYLVKIEDNAGSKTIRVTDWEMDVIEELEKINN